MVDESAPPLADPEQAESWARVVAIGLLAAPVIVFGIAALIVVTMGPPSPVWKWATGARKFLVATPLTGVLQLILWACLPPRRWYGRLLALLFTLPTLALATWMVLWVRGPR